MECYVQDVLNAKPSKRSLNWHYEYLHSDNPECIHSFTCTKLNACCNEHRIYLLVNEISITDCQCSLCTCSRYYASVEIKRVMLSKEDKIKIENELTAIVNELNF